MIYEVNLSVDREIAEAYASWLEPHMAQMLEFEGFESATWLAREPEMEASDGSRELWTIQYSVSTRAHLERYFVEGAERMRGDGLERFSGRFEATRRVLRER